MGRQHRSAAMLLAGPASNDWVVELFHGHDALDVAWLYNGSGLETAAFDVLLADVPPRSGRLLLIVICLPAGWRHEHGLLQLGEPLLVSLVASIMDVHR